MAGAGVFPAVWVGRGEPGICRFSVGLEDGVIFPLGLGEKGLLVTKGSLEPVPWTGVCWTGGLNVGRGRIGVGWR